MNKVVETYYVSVIDNQGGNLGYGGPTVPVDSSYVFDVMQNGQVTVMQEFISRCPENLRGQIMNAPRNTGGAFSERYSWKKK